MSKKKVIIITRKGTFNSFIERTTNTKMHKLADNDSGVYQVRDIDLHRIANTGSFKKEFLVTDEENYEESLYKWKRHFQRLADEANRQLDFIWKELNRLDNEARDKMIARWNELNKVDEEHITYNEAREEMKYLEHYLLTTYNYRI